MTDLVMRGTRADILALLRDRGFAIDTEEGVATKRGLEVFPWAGSGRLMRTPGTPGDDTVDPPVPGEAPTFVPGFVAHIRIHANLKRDDDEDDGEGGRRSKLIRFLVNNGEVGTLAGLDMVTYQNVQFFRIEDVRAKQAEWGTTSQWGGYL